MAAREPMNETMKQTPTTTEHTSIESIREKLSGRTGEQYWRSLEEVAASDEFREAMSREFPSEVSVWEDGVSRRKFLHLMGASIALAGLSSCVKQPDEKIIPYVKQPEYLIPGKPLTFASAFVSGGFATGILVTSHMGRPTKIQGNPDHPASRGASDVFSQASILHLYDPDRSQAVRKNGDISSADKFLIELFGALDAQKPLGGRGIRVLTGTVTSPTFLSQMKALLSLYPGARWVQYEPSGIASERRGTELAFGREVQTVHDFKKADVVLSLDADFLSEGPAHLVYARDFAERRRVTGTKADMNRLYVVESFPTPTGSIADHRLPLRAGRIGTFAAALAAELGAAPGGAAGLSAEESKWVKAVAGDLLAHRGSSVVITGPGGAPELHALVHGINEFLGNNGSTVSFLEPAEASIPDAEQSLAGLVDDLNAGEVDLLVIAGGNPCFDAPAGLRFAEALGKARMSVNLSLYNDETARSCRWHVPESHYLEAWSDARAFDGTASVIQPLIAPLYNTMSVHELFAELTGRSGTKAYDIIRERWKDAAGSGDFETFWKTSLNDGAIRGTASRPADVRFAAESMKSLSAAAGGGDAGSGVEVNFRPDPTILDGRHANNGWLQELPKPVTKLTWDNAAFMSPSLAESLGVADEELVRVEAGGAAVTLPALILPGHPAGSVTLHFGYGRRNAGRVGNRTGVDVYPLRASSSQLFAAATVGKASGKRSLARTQDHHSMEGRAIFRTATVDEFERNPAFAREMSHVPTKEESLYPEHEYDGYKWAMSIDLNACTGCNACVIGCQSENNIPVVGRDQVLNGREMHWIRIDRYYEGDLDNPAIYSQPVACMHCENAPCEPVCPVAATSHDHEGLNVMVYNRCVGTRYCSNNCPYKVRRFNFLQFSDKDTESLQMLYNPDVTVRNRGVMEKCTYCVQRISAARIDAKKEDREIREGEIMTACQSACPTRAIVFGNLNDPESAVAKAKAEPRDYGLLTELNTVPRTSYLARVRNPNPALESEG